MAQFDVHRNLGAVQGSIPFVVINGQAVVLHPLEMSSIPTHQLGEWVATLEDSGLAITDALDELFTRTWK